MMIGAGSGKSDLTLGINGLGRIGKLTLWHHVQRQFFKKIVVTAQIISKKPAQIR